MCQKKKIELVFMPKREFDKLESQNPYKPSFLHNEIDFVRSEFPIAFQCDNCCFRKVSFNPKDQDSTCEKCSKGKMKSKDFENTSFQDKD